MFLCDGVGGRCCKAKLASEVGSKTTNMKIANEKAMRALSSNIFYSRKSKADRKHGKRLRESLLIIRYIG